jgi:amino acid transporter
MANQTSQHILSTSANLLGFCLVVLTSLHITDKSALGFLDEITSVVAVLLIFSCFFSFFSIRSSAKERALYLERIADYLFISSLFGILVIIVGVFLALL